MKRFIAVLAILALWPATVAGIYGAENVPSPAMGAPAAGTPDIDSASYVVVKDGHLFLNGARVRFWGAIGSFPGASYEANETAVQRLKDLGFNMIRFWGSPSPYTKGDRSRGDLADHFLWCCAKAGMRVWYAGLNGLGSVSVDNVDIIRDPGTAEAWKKAIAPQAADTTRKARVDTAAVIAAIKQRRVERDDTTTRITAEDIRAAFNRMSRRRQGNYDPSLRNNLARYWDRRIQAVVIERQRELVDHVNQHTGYRYADDPVFAIWELSNEEWWFHRIKNGAFINGLPEFLRQELFSQWNAFLARKYVNEARLREAWRGNLLPGEALTKKSVRLLPFYEPVMDRQAVSLGVNVRIDTMPQAFSRSDFTGRRGGDVIEFLLSIWISGKKREADSLKTRGASTRRCPLVWDTGIGWDLQTQFMQQHADAIAHDSYFNGAFHTDRNHKRFPWLSQLEELPKVSWQDPWLEHNKMEGKPFLVYETQIMQPAKYRAEYPMSIAKLAAIQDWDAICWHYWGPVPDPKKKDPYARPLDYASANHHPQGYHYQYDEVQMSAMKAASEIFKHGLLAPASDPTTFVFGRTSLYDWEMNGYGRTGQMFLPTVYRYGMRLLIDSTARTDRISGPHFLKRGVYEACPIVPTPQIRHDWQRGYLIFDAPGVKMYTGFLAQYGKEVRFKDNVTLSNVMILNPPKMPYPVTEQERYIEFSLTSCDSLPLARTRRAIISLVSTSFNTGFKVLLDKLADAPWQPMKEWNWSTDAFENPANGPVLVSRVGAKITAPAIKGMEYRLLDWHMRELAKETTGEGTIEIPNNLPVFVVELTRKG